ncbi:MAG: ATP-binding protein [Phormidesmis sp.]
MSTLMTSSEQPETRALQETVTRQQRQQKLMATVALRISLSAGLDETLQTAAAGMRQVLDCDRAAIYRFDSDHSGIVVAESVLPGCRASLGVNIADTCLQHGGLREQYLNGYKTVMPDVYAGGLSDCHIKLLERFQIKANLVVPIVLNHPNMAKAQLWGLLFAHHCRGTRDWRAFELSILDDLAVQLAIAIRQNQMISQLEERAQALSKANQRLVKTARQLKARNQELDQFAYIASHDLRAPLRAIANLADWLAEDLSGQVPAENEEQMQLIQARAKRLDSFVMGLLDYSRAGRHSLQPAPVDTHKLLNEIIDSLAPPPAFTIKLPETTPLLNTSEMLLQQVLSNLIGNAIKYHHRPDGSIHIDIQDESDHVTFIIADDGPGIDPQYHERIFGVFQTLHSRDEIESTGIGLSIVKKVVEQQGGEVSLQSALDQGSTFVVTWPKTGPNASESACLKRAGQLDPA